MGDSRRPQTTQFDMVQAFDMLARMAILPLRANDHIDIGPANYVGAAIVKIHQMEKPHYRIYHLSSGTGSQTYRELTDSLATQGGWGKPGYWPWLGRPFSGTVNWLAFKAGAIGYGASLLKVFWPYLDSHPVFYTSRVVEEVVEEPGNFSSYAYPLLQFSRTNHFKYPAKPWPAEAAGVAVERTSAGSAVA